jgi:hypothetical protein
VFSDLKRVAYDGPLSVACEWHLDDGRSFSDVLRQEVRFFKHHRDTAA